MRAIRTLVVFVLVLGLLAVAVPGLGADPPMVYTDAGDFLIDSGATLVAFPADADGAYSLTPFAGLTGYSCELGSLVLPGGDVTVAAVNGSYICFIDNDWDAGPGNTSPTPTGPTLVANGEDDFTLTFNFATPVHSIGLGLLTNSTAVEAITLYYEGGGMHVVGDASLGTLPNTFEFVGLISDTPVASIKVDTTGGASQNEGITELWTSSYYPNPTLACPEGQDFVSGETGAVVPISAADGYPYELHAMGTFFAGGRTLYDIEADAEYSQDGDQRLAGDPWTDLVNKYESDGEGLLELKVDGSFVEWGAFDAGHHYIIEALADGSSFDFNIYDVFYPNNTGGLCVDVVPLALRSVNAGGQLIEPDPADRRGNKPYKVSFGGYVDDIDGALECEWQINLHNVAEDELDGAKYHSTECFRLLTSGPDDQYEGIGTVYTRGTFNGEPGYSAILRLDDHAEPSVFDTVRIEIFEPGVVPEYNRPHLYDTSPSHNNYIGEFPNDSTYVGGTRTFLDRGNVQVNFYELP